MGQGGSGLRRDAKGIETVPAASFAELPRVIICVLFLPMAAGCSMFCVLISLCFPFWILECDTAEGACPLQLPGASRASDSPSVAAPGTVVLRPSPFLSPFTQLSRVERDGLTVTEERFNSSGPSSSWYQVPRAEPVSSGGNRYSTGLAHLCESSWSGRLRQQSLTVKARYSQARLFTRENSQLVWLVQCH